MQKIKDIPLTKAYRLLAHGPTVMITSFDGEKHNACTVAWLTLYNTDPPQIIAVISPEHKTYQNILKTLECVINIPTVPQKDLVKMVGSKSGFKVDKMKHIDAFESKDVKPLRIAGCCGWLEAKLIGVAFEDRPEILLFEAVSAAAPEDALTEDFLLNIERYPTLHHLGEKVFGICSQKI